MDAERREVAAAAPAAMVVTHIEGTSDERQ